jgi:arabinan endo-1,5-alpha-L-arabinosidase
MTRIVTSSLRAGGIGGLFAAMILFSPFFSHARTPKEAVLFYDTPDPAAIEAADGSGVYLFTTGKGINITRSKNLTDWERKGRVFDEEVPAWVREKIPGAAAVWAPDIVFRNGLYYLYYSVSTFGSQRSVIGLAVNKTVNPDDSDYHWEDRGLVLESAPAQTDYNAIDSALFVDHDGKAYLFWGSFWTGIKAVEVCPETGMPGKYRGGNLKIPEDYVTVANRGPDGDTSIEAAYVIRHDDDYFLFTSRGGCCDGVKSTYHIAIGRAKSPLGPYLDKEGKPMKEGGGTVILSSTERWKGTGHNGFFQTGTDGNRKDWLILAAFDAKAPKKGRLTQIRPVTWEDSGWPVIGGIYSPFAGR